MRIAVDVQTIGRARSGDETYYRNLVSEFAAAEAGHDFWLYYTQPEAQAFFKRLPANFHPRRMAPANPFLRVPIAAPWRLLREPVDVFHTQYVGVAARGAKLVLTVHDLSYERYPEAFPANRALFLKLTRWSARLAAAVIAVSESTKRDLVSLYGLPEEKIRVVPNAASARFAPCTDPVELWRVRTKYGIQGDYVLSVGTLQPRKNLPRLLEAFIEARKRPGFDCRLVLVGKKGWGPDEAKTLPAGVLERKDVIFTGYVEDEDLPALYSGATAFAYPSLYEGFGLPVLEAMACGTPVLTSQVSSLPEVCGDAAVYVHPLRTGEICRGLLTLASDKNLRKILQTRGLYRAQKFSWRESARKTLAVYESVAARSGRRAAAAAVRSPMEVRP